MFANQLTENLNKLRCEGVLCDIVIKCGNVSFNAHRAVLAASCEYFRVLFTTSMQEKTSNLVNLDVPPSIAGEMLSFLYTGRVDLNDDNARELLVAADYFMIEELKQQCEDFILKHLLCVGTCLLYYSIAKEYNCKRLELTSQNLVLNNFKIVIEQEEYTHLSFRHIHDIISSDDLFVDSEQDVYEGIISWVTTAKERTEFFEELFKEVRLCFVPIEFITGTIAKHPLVKQNDACMSLVFKRIGSALMENDRQQDLKVQPRKCLQTKEVAIVCLGGIANGKTSKETLVYIPHKDTVNKQDDMSVGRDEHTVVVGNNVLYVIGGVQCPKGIECYNPAINAWCSMASLPERSIGSTAVYIDGKIYIMGGRDGFECVSTVQCYNIEYQSVEILPSLTFPRKAANAVYLNDGIYLIGGCTYDNDALDTTERMMVGNERKWERKASLSHRRKYSCAGVIASGKILVAGGFQDSNPIALGTCELYDPVLDTWNEICSLDVHRGAAAMGFVGNYVYILGGRSDRRSTDAIEYYDEEIDKWSLSETRLPSPCAWLQCGVLTFTK